jgi:hypothetical protein
MNRPAPRLVWIQETQLAPRVVLRIGERRDRKVGDKRVAWLTVSEPTELTRLERARLLAAAATLQADPDHVLWLDLTVTRPLGAGRPIRRVVPGGLPFLASCLARACGA